MKCPIAVVSAILLLSVGSGCGTPIRATVTRFHVLPQTGEPHTFSFLPTAEQNGSLEYATYCAKVTERLTAYGWRLADGSTSPSDYLIVMSYAIDDGRTVTTSLPIFGQTGGGTAFTSGTVRTNTGAVANYSGITTAPATFGEVGAIPIHRREYARRLNLSIMDRANSTAEHPIKLFEGRVLSSGSIGEISEVLPTMIIALFEEFPGNSGKTDSVRMRIR